MSSAKVQLDPCGLYYPAWSASKPLFMMRNRTLFDIAAALTDKGLRDQRDGVAVYSVDAGR